jgi:predicted CoA-binding protein
VTGTDATVERILTRYDTITVVGASRAPAKAAHSVPAHSAEARAIAEDAGLLYVEDRCLIIEQRRLNLDAPVPG